MDFEFFKETWLTNIFGGIVRCFFHGDESHLSGNIESFFVFGTIAFYYNRKFALYAFLASVFLPTFIQEVLTNEVTGGYGFSNVGYCAVGFSIVSFLCINYNKYLEYSFPLIIFKVGIVLYFLNYFFHGTFWNLLSDNQMSEELNVGWIRHSIGFFIGISFAASSLSYKVKKESDWDVTKEESLILQGYLQVLRNSKTPNSEKQNFNTSQSNSHIQDDDSRKIRIALPKLFKSIKIQNFKLSTFYFSYENILKLLLVLSAILILIVILLELFS